MNQLTYSLCQEPIIGVIMWVTSLCAFPPLFHDVPFSIEKAGSTVSQSFTVPVDKKYYFEVCFEFASVEARKIDKIVGTQYDEYFYDNSEIKGIPEEKKRAFGHVIPFKIIIKNKLYGKVIIDRTFYSRGVSSHVDNKKWRRIGIVELKRGDYITEVTCIENQSGLNDVITKISLTAGHGK